MKVIFKIGKVEGLIKNKGMASWVKLEFRMNEFDILFDLARKTVVTFKSSVST